MGSFYLYRIYKCSTYSIVSTYKYSKYNRYIYLFALIPQQQTRQIYYVIFLLSPVIPATNLLQQPKLRVIEVTAFSVIVIFPFNNFYNFPFLKVFFVKYLIIVLRLQKEQLPLLPGAQAIRVNQQQEYTDQESLSDISLYYGILRISKASITYYIYIICIKIQRVRQIP